MTPQPTVLEVVKKSTEYLAGRGVGSARLNAELLVGHALELGRMQLYLQFERTLTEPELARIRPLVRRRGLGEPVQYITGSTDFHGLRLKVDRRALIPRPETEQLVELLLGRLTLKPMSILDLGTGSGAIALALARKYPESRVVALDISAEALGLARANAEAATLSGRIEFLESDWFAALPPDEMFELIVANPPYLSAQELAASKPEVRDFEPTRALVSAGADGLGDLEKILRGARRHLAPGGMIALETGPGQHAALSAIARDAGFSHVDSAKDLAKFDRFIFAA